MSIPVILDTDIGSDIDDTWALTMLLRSPELDLKLVVTETCDTVYRARLVAKFLEVAGRTDVTVGVGLRFDACNEFQLPWLGDYDLSSYPGEVAQDGVRTMIEYIRASSTPVTLIGIGPAPNIRRALEIAPDIAGNCRFVGMYGSIDRGYGDGSDPIPETNVREDVDAAKAIFAAPWREIIITPLDTCDQAILSGDRYAKIRDSQDPLLRALVENNRIWAGLVTWVDAGFIEERSNNLFDTVAVYLAYSEEGLAVEEMKLQVTDDGRTVRAPDGDPVRVAMQWTNLEGFLDHLTERLLSQT